jgi:hypothetical protein
MGDAVSFEDDAALLVGEWVDQDGDLHRIAQAGETFTVASRDGDDGEVFEVRSVSWRPGYLRWTMHVPSTGYVLTYRTVRLGASTMEVRWKNAAADPKALGLSKVSGTETFKRVTGDG